MELSTLLVIGLVLLVLLLLFRAPFFRAVWESDDRTPTLDNRVVTPPESSETLAETVREAEEAGTIDRDGLPRH